MIDGLLKDVIDPMWERLARPLARGGFTPNQVTAMGMVLIVVASAAYFLHQNHWIYGLTLAVSFVFDALDGAVARQTGLSSKVGGYFDAMVDRYQELIVLMSIGYVTGLWPLVMAGFAGAMITSYAKARTAIETPVSNTDWPDFFERMERVIYLCVMLVIAGVTGAGWVLTGGLIVYVLLCHFTALQRARRAVYILKQVDAGRP